MVRLNNLFSLLTWFFTPIKLYGGDTDSDSDNKGGGSGSDGDNSSNDNDSDSDDGWGGWGSLENAANFNDNSSNHRNFNNPTTSESSYSLDTSSTFEYSARLSVQSLFDSVPDANALSSFGLGEESIKDYDRNTLSATYQAAPYKANISATVTAELTAGFFGNSMTTTRSVPNMLGGYTVDINKGGLFGSSSLDTYTTNHNGSITEHITTYSIGNTSWSYDTHYWAGNNVQFGFAAEMAADFAEFLGVKTPTARKIAAVVEVASLLYTAVIPGMQALVGGLNMLSISKTYGLTMAIGGFLSMWEALDQLNGMFTGESWYNPGTNIADTMFGNFGLGDNETFELGDIINQDITEDYYPMILSANSLKRDSSMLPVNKSQNQYIKPTQNKENIMQSQQAVFIDYRGGLSSVLAPNLIGANEGSEFTNISIDKGTMESKKLGIVTDNGYLNEYTLRLPSGYLYHSSSYFSSVKLGNFIYIVTDNLPGIYQLDYQSLDRDSDINDLVQAQLNPPINNPIVIDSLKTVLVVYIDTVDDDTPAAAKDNVKKDDKLNIYYGSTLITTTEALTSEDIETGSYEVLLNKYYPDEDSNLFSYRILRAEEIIYPESNNIVLLNEDEIESELWDEYTYAYTYYDSTSGFESAPAFSSSVLKKVDALEITELEYSSDSNVDFIRLYRVGGYSNTYRLIAEIDNISSSETTSYFDYLSEEYNPSILDTQNLAIIEDLVGLIEHKGTLFAYKNNQVYFSRPGKPNMWSEFNSIRVGGIVSGISSTPLGVLIFTDNSQTYLLGGTDKYNFTLSTLAKTIGCYDGKSIANHKNTTIWIDYEGLMVSVGSSVSNLSKEKVDLSDIGDIIDSMVYDSVYYLIGTNYSLLVDFRYNTPSFQKLLGLEHIHYYKGKIYTQINGLMYKDSFSKVGDYMELHYKAPMFIGNSFDILTEFNKINVTFKGDFTYKIYIDEIEVSTGTISSVGIKVEELKLPSSYNEGLGLELELIGTGEIKSFRYIFNNVNIN